MTETATRAPLLHLPPSTLTALHRALAHDRAPADAAALARQMGFESGEGFYHAFRHWLEHHAQQADVDPARVPADEFWHRLSGFFLSLGWGRLEFERLHPGVASLRSAEWAEAEPEARSRQPTCHFTTGLLADLLGRVTGGELAVFEVECRSRGDEACRFLLGSPEALATVYEAMRQGAPFRDAVERLG